MRWHAAARPGMNRTIVGIGLVLLLFGFALAAFPIVVTGHEAFDFEQEAGLYVAPVGLLVILLGAIGHDPAATTVPGAFGNVEETSRRMRTGGDARPRPVAPINPKDPVACRYCRTIITWDLAICPRCARARECRYCGRPLGVVLDRPTCPTCARAEVFCSCPRVARPGSPAAGAVGSRRG